MTITWIPVRGQGYCSKGKLIGQGQCIDEIKCVMKKGTFNSAGNLNCSSGTVINYSDSSNVSVRAGTYQDGKENGPITEYVFGKSNWSSFRGSSPVNSTRYTHVFSQGTWQSTSETKNNVAIVGDFQKNNNNIWRCFDCKEN